MQEKSSSLVDGSSLLALLPAWSGGAAPRHACAAEQAAGILSVPSGPSMQSVAQAGPAAIQHEQGLQEVRVRQQGRLHGPEAALRNLRSRVRVQGTLHGHLHQGLGFRVSVAWKLAHSLVVGFRD